MPGLKLIAQIRAIGLANGLRAIRYALARELVDRAVNRSSPPSVAERPGQLLDVSLQPSGAQLSFERSELEVIFLLPDLVRITWGSTPPPVPYALARTSWPDVAVTVEKSGASWMLRTAAMGIAVAAEGALLLLDGAGKTLREELPPERQGAVIMHRVRMRPEEHVYGLGNRVLGLNLRGRTLRMWNRDPGTGCSPGDDPLYLCIPTYLALHTDGSYLVFYENSHAATFTFRDSAEIGFEGGSLRYYLAPGPPSRAYERYAELTGRPALPPLWALGYHQSRWSYRTADEVRKVVKGFLANGLPLSAIHLDIGYMDGYRVFTWDRRHFADFRAFAEELAHKDIRLVTILNPGVKIDREYDVFKEGEAAHAFCTLPNGKPVTGPVWPGWAAFPDFMDVKTREWWAAQYPRLLDAGVAGVWHDMNEPTAFAAWGDQTLPLAVHHAFEGRGGTHAEGHNLYGLAMAKAGYEGLRRHRPDRRPWILTRSGWAGVQRFAWNWTGDVDSSWEALRQTIATILGLALSGIAYTGSDVGGFAGAPSAELYLRWLQAAAFTPFLRTHSAFFGPRREPWSFGEPWLTMARHVLLLRIRLLPYWYSLAWQTSRTGHPLVRPLFWPAGDSPELWAVHDAFFVGDALLVAPVLEEGARAREVVLPTGVWYELDGDAVFTGIGRARMDAPLERVPVLVRAGSVLPMQDSAGNHLTLHLYPPVGDEGGGLLYSDAGDGDGTWRVDRFRLRRDADTLVFSWAQEGEYPFPYRAIDLVPHGGAVRRVVIDGVEAAPTASLRQPFREARLEL